MRLSRRLLLFAIPVLCATVVPTAQAVGLPTAQTSVPPLWNMAYGTLTKGPDGRWAYSSATGLTPDVVLPAIEKSGAVYVRAALTGAPSGETALYYNLLRAQDPQLRLGARIEVGRAASVQDVLDQARKLRNSPAGCMPAPSAYPCYFDWLFLDTVHGLPTEELQALTDRLQASGPTDGGGWQLVMTNDTGFSPTSRIVHGIWAHGHSVKVLGIGNWDTTGKQRLIDALRDPGQPVITQADQRFIAIVNRRDPGSYPVLKFEIHNETDKLRSLSPRLQRTLIQRLSDAQAQYGFRLIYPLFVSRGHDRSQCGSGCLIYNSLGGPGFSPAAAGQDTYALQQRLMLNSPFAP